MSLTVLFVIAIYGFFFIASLWNPIFGVAGYLSVYILYNPDIWWGQGIASALPRPSFLAVLFLGLGCLLHWRSLNWRLSRNELSLYAFLAVAWLTSMFFGVGANRNTLVYLVKLTKMFVFIFLFIRSVNSFKQFKIVIWVIVAEALFLGYQAHVVSSGYFQGGRLEDLGGIDFREANQLAAFLCLALVLLGYQMLRSNLWKNALYVVGAGLIANTIIMTRSRAVFLGMLVALPFAFFTVPGKYRTRVTLCIVLGGVLFAALSDVTFLARMSTIRDSAALIGQDAGSAGMTRIQFWKASLRMFADHPLGVGVKQFEQLVPLYDPSNKGMDAHNTYVLCYTELGIVGIALFLIILGQSFSALRRIPLGALDDAMRSEVQLFRSALCTALVMFAAGLMTTHSVLYSEMLWIVLTLPILLERTVTKGAAARIEEAPGPILVPVPAE